MAIKIHNMNYQDYVKKVKDLDRELFEYPYETRQSYNDRMAKAVYATSGNKMVGFFTIKRKPNSDTCSLHAIGVEPKFQGKGIGKLLLKKAVKYSKSLGFKFMDLGVFKHEKVAFQMYKKFGFKTTSSTKDRHIMKLNLDKVKNSM